MEREHDGKKAIGMPRPVICQGPIINWHQVHAPKKNDKVVSFTHLPSRKERQTLLVLLSVHVNPIKERCPTTARQTRRP